MSNNKLASRKQDRLTGDALTYVQLTEKIEDLEQQLNLEEEKLNGLSNYFYQHVYPIIKEKSSAYLKYAFQLENILFDISLSKSYEKLAKDLILHFLTESFRFKEATSEAIALYNRNSNHPYKSKIENTTLEEKNEQKKSFEEYKSAHRQKHQTKSKKEKLELLQEVEKETVRKKGLKSIYITLSKILHPDLEQNEQLKLEKEELMKKVTIAYNEKDILTLLQLESNWIEKTRNHLPSTDQQLIQTYIEILKERATLLNEEIENLKNQPRYSVISSYAELSDKKANQQLKKDKNSIAQYIAALNQHLSYIEQTKDMRLLMDLIDQLLQRFSEQ